MLIITNSSSIYAEPWKIGVLVCVSGACAESGENSRRGIELAIEELNNAGGVLGKEVEYVLEDTAEGTSSGAGAVTAFKRLTTDSSIKYMVGPSWTPGALSVAPIAAKSLRTIGYKGPLFAILMGDTRISTSQGALEGTVFAGYPEPDSEFSKSFKEKFGIEPGIGADTSYDTVKLYAWVIQKAGTFDVNMVQKEMISAKYAGASG